MEIKYFNSRIIGMSLVVAGLVGLMGMPGCALLEDKDFGRKIGVALTPMGHSDNYQEELEKARKYRMERDAKYEADMRKMEELKNYSGE